MLPMQIIHINKRAECTNYKLVDVREFMVVVEEAQTPTEQSGSRRDA